MKTADSQYLQWSLIPGMGESREQALDRLRDEAVRVGADAVVGCRFTTSMITQGASEILAYGTGVKLADE
ncbi:MAG: heavy metal-binding domain-containing protein [Fuerstiella sp.]|nr:heavy metal-binding domain-containing protein [Fuerstiella sp.]